VLRQQAETQDSVSLADCAGSPAGVGAIPEALPMPFVWIDLFWAGAFTGAVFYFRGIWPRGIFSSLGLAAVMLAAAEA